MHPLTDAFIKGRLKFKKINGKYFDRRDKPKAACHFGAMFWGYFGTTLGLGEGAEIYLTEFPELHNLVSLPCDHYIEYKEGQISSVLIHLNDEHDGRSGWGDEMVAKWLESVLTKPASNDVLGQG